MRMPSPVLSLVPEATHGGEDPATRLLSREESETMDVTSTSQKIKTSGDSCLPAEEHEPDVSS